MTETRSKLSYRLVQRDGGPYRITASRQDYTAIPAEAQVYDGHDWRDVTADERVRLERQWEDEIF